MKPNTIVLTDKGIGCIQLNPVSIGMTPTGKDRQQAASEQAMKQVVLFKDQVFARSLFNHMEYNKLYPVPDGYEIKIETHSIYNGKDNPSIEYAILVPKEEIMAEKFWSNIEKSYAHVKQPTIKQPTSIEENKWCDSCGKRTTWINGECENYKNKSSIEEAAENSRKTKYIDGSITSYTRNDWQACYKEGFIAGAKHNSYQIKEANELIKYVMENTTGDHTCWLSPRRRKQFEKYATQFEQFKQEKK